MNERHDGSGAGVPPAMAAARTLTHYEMRAEAYREGTWDHDVSQNVAALLEALDGTPPLRILDFGCGPGRDLLTFRNLGHEAVGLDGAAAFVSMARAATGCEVWHQDFLALDLPPARFDGIFANASLFHVPTSALPAVLSALRETLRPGGVLFTSNPRGDNREGWFDMRFGVYHDLAQWRRFLGAGGFAEIGHYFRPPGQPRERQPWLASLWRRQD